MIWHERLVWINTLPKESTCTSREKKKPNNHKCFWIGLGPGLDRSRSGPAFCCMFQLGCSVTTKRTRRWPRSKWTASLFVNVCNSCSLAAGPLTSLVASQLAWPYSSCKVQFGCLTTWAAWLYNSLLLGCFARWIAAEQEATKTCNHH